MEATMRNQALKMTDIFSDPRLGSINELALKDQHELVEFMIKRLTEAKSTLENMGEETGSGERKPISAPPELAPTKNQFIELYGQEEFNKVKRIGSPRTKFFWF
jgi:hypothetical protein